MKITTKGYNIPYITDLGTFTSGEAKKVGTIKDYAQIRHMIEWSGEIHGTFKLGDENLTGFATANPFDTGIELIITTNYQNTLQIITGVLYPAGNDLYCIFTKNEIS